MSLIIARRTNECGMIVVDTAAINGDGSAGEITKLWYLAGIHTLIAYRGDRLLAFRVYSALALATQAISFDLIRTELRDIVTAVVENTPGEAAKTELVVMGWSDQQDRLVMLRVVWSPDKGTSEVVEQESALTPSEPFGEQPPMVNSAEDAKALAPRMVEWLHAQGAAGGGRLLMACMNPSACTIKEIATLAG